MPMGWRKRREERREASRGGQESTLSKDRYPLIELCAYRTKHDSGRFAAAISNDVSFDTCTSCSRFVA